MLRDEEIAALWRRYRAQTEDWEAWRQRYLALVSAARVMDEAELASAATQERLWSAQAICALGNAEHVQVQAAWTDPQVVAAVVALRGRRWSARAELRAQEIEDAAGQILGLVSPRHTTTRPAARLQRLMAALLPEELHCVISWSANRDLIELLLPDRRGRAPVSSQVLCRARLRDVLGQEADLPEHIDRSLFCWWLYGQSEALRRPDDTDDGAAHLPSPLRLWPPTRLFKGLPTLPEGAESLRDLTRLALPGVARPDLVEALAEDPRVGSLSVKARRGAVQQALLLGLLEEREGLLHPTAAGFELLEHARPEQLTEQLLRRVYGVAQLLRRVQEAPGAPLGPWAAAALSGSSWTLPGLLSWASSLGLLVSGGDPEAPALSLDGERWAARLPEALPGPPGVARGAPPVEASRPWEEPPLGALQAALQADAEGARLVFEEAQLRALHLAWHSNPRKRFAILSGLSGTGKTALALAYARAYCAALGLDPDDHREVVAVSPDWRDPAGLLGYFSALHEEPTFLAEPALRLILQAARAPARPFFLILDEMNLARVERYLAPLLSAMETGEPIVLHTAPDEVNGVPPRVPWPHNLFLAGTVNMDESTHAFSDKVLDRAFTLEFWEVDLPRFFAARPGPRDEGAEAALVGLYEALRPARRHFGYRSAHEVLAFVQAAARVGAPTQEALDQALFSRVLPRLRGEDSRDLRAALDAALALCEARALPRCAQKLDEMRRRLQEVGVTRFWA